MYLSMLNNSSIALSAKPPKIANTRAQCLLFLRISDGRLRPQNIASLGSTESSACAVSFLLEHYMLLLYK